MKHGGRLILFAAVLLAGFNVPAFAQGTARAASAFTVSVTVVRSCAVATPAALDPSSRAGDVRLSCGRSASTSSVRTGGIVPVSGATAPALVSTSKSETGLAVSINF